METTDALRFIPNKLHLVPWCFDKLLPLFNLLAFKNAFESSCWCCTSFVKSFNVFNRLVSIYMISILWHFPLFIRKLLKSNSTTSRKIFWMHFCFWAMLIVSMIHALLSGKHSAGGKSFCRKVESVALFVLRSEPSLVSKDHGMGPSEWVNAFFTASCWVCANNVGWW